MSFRLVTLPHLYDSDFSRRFLSGLQEVHIKENIDATIYRADLSESNYDKSFNLVEELRKFFGKEFYVGKSSKQLYTVTSLWLDDDILIEVNDNTKANDSNLFNVFQLEYISTNENKIKAIHKLVEENSREEFKNKAQAKSIYTIIRDGNYNRIQHISDVETSSLIRENYSISNVKEYEHVIGCIGSDCSCGSVVILSGPPGTGKTNMIKGMIAEAKGCQFIVVNQAIAGALGAPDFMSLFIDNEYRMEGNKVLIFEDSDWTIVNRDNSGSHTNRLADLLNFSDGIIGSVLNFRIIVTTNAPKISIDPAILRPGRLCRHIEVGELNKEESNIAYKKLTGNELVSPVSHHTIADIYRLAIDSGHVVKDKVNKEQGQYI